MRETSSSKFQPNFSGKKCKKSSKKRNKNIRKNLQKHIQKDIQEGDDLYILDSRNWAGQLMLSNFILDNANKYLALAMEQKETKEEGKTQNK